MKTHPMVGFLAVSAAVVLIGFSRSSERQMAVTLDDLPSLSHGLIPDDEQVRYVGRILQTLKKHRIRAVGFVVGSSIRPANRALLDDVLRDGHTLGNHTDTHPDLNRATADNFLSDIDACVDKLGAFQVPVRYFRYPMLHRGETAEKRDAVTAGIRARGLTVAPVTIDSDEADYNLRYVRAVFEGKGEDPDAIAREYIAHMVQKSREYAALADRVVRRPIPHILLLHMNYINSMVLDELLQKFAADGWTFISLDEAMADPVYSLPDSYVGPKGRSWLERLVD